MSIQTIPIRKEGSGRPKSVTTKAKLQIKVNQSFFN